MYMYEKISQCLRKFHKECRTCKTLLSFSLEAHFVIFCKHWENFARKCWVFFRRVKRAFGSVSFITDWNFEMLAAVRFHKALFSYNPCWVYEKFQVIYILYIHMYRPDTSYLKRQGDFSLAKGTSMRNLSILLGLLKGHQGNDQGQWRQLPPLPPLSIRPACMTNSSIYFCDSYFILISWDLTHGVTANWNDGMKSKLFLWSEAFQPICVDSIWQRDHWTFVNML